VFDVSGRAAEEIIAIIAEVVGLIRP
jgi:hypothetical protein